MFLLSQAVLAVKTDLLLNPVDKAFSRERPFPGWL
jgi:hypothetical protein